VDLGLSPYVWTLPGVNLGITEHPTRKDKVVVQKLRSVARADNSDGAFMEPAGATGGKRWQMERLRKRLKQAKTVAAGCDRLPETFHGKEGSTVRVRQRALKNPCRNRYSSSG
jgi:hypothetical protein